ncbi:adult cuticle protein 1-like [Topomyia yanbarensis]|uniref:adult cuticle protein 1-like n=1 Tax=Topomyia yanbarensis TaxID=2498891 RepID=UPI00273A859E|nr:adult cuticle protein 1-like [Topomyia yanbarensis]
MKCFAAIVIVAISLVADGAVIPWIWPGGPIAIPAPAGLAIPGATVVQSNPPAAVLLPAPGAIALDTSGAPVVLLAPAPAPPAVVAVPAPVPAAATSVSATRGSVHVAPLPGHSVSQQQLNLAPAPGSE